MQKSSRIFRMTQQRRQILDYMRNNHHHPSAQEVYEDVRSSMPHISLGTVYRNLDVLCEQGLILKLNTDGGARNRFDGNSVPHCHVHCLQCGAVHDVEVDLPRALQAEAAQRSGFEIHGCQMDFQGLCPVCSYKEASRSA